MFKPSGSALVLNVAVPPLSALLARVVAPSRRETRPVGVPPDGDETVALKLTASPGAEGFLKEINFVAVSSKPTPVSGSNCGLSDALSVMLTAALRLPVADGVKVTLMLQLPPTETDVTQLLISAKSPLLAPVILRAVMVNVALPTLGQNRNLRTAREAYGLATKI
jgi:hypothetical protein